MRDVLRGLARNLVAGARLALFAPVERSAFRIDLVQLALVFVVSALVDCALDRVRIGAGATLNGSALVSELVAAAVLVAIAALLAWAFSERSLVVGLPVVVLASLPLVQVANLVRDLLIARENVPGWVAVMFGHLALAWFLATLWRSTFVALEPSPRRFVRSTAGVFLLAVPAFLPASVLPNASWWQTAGPKPLAEVSSALVPIKDRHRDGRLG